MKFTVNQKEFAEALNIASRAIVSKTPMEILKGFYIEAYDDIVVIMGNNLEIGIKTSIPAMVEVEGRCIIEAKMISDIVRKLPDEQVSVRVEDSTVHIKCLKSKFTIREMVDNGYPTVEDLDDAIYQSVNGQVFFEMIRKTQFAVSTDVRKPIFMGQLLEIDTDHMNLVALDGYRLAHKKCEISSSVGYQSIIIPGKTMSEIMRLCQGIEGEIKIGIESRHASFVFENTIVNTRLIQGEFTKYEQIIPKEFATKIKVNRQEFMNSLDRATLVSGNYLVKLKMQNDEFIITAQDKEIGDLEEIIGIELEGKELEIAFNIRYFLEALRVIEEDTIYLNFNSNVSPCVIKPEVEQDYTYLLLPVRM